MRYIIHFFLALLFIFSISSCNQKSEQQKQTVLNENKIVHKEYGKWNTSYDSISVVLELDSISNWKELIQQTENIVCSDSVPKIIIEKKTIKKTIYINNPCWENFDCILIKQKNIIEIVNDSIYKGYDNKYPMDSLAHVIKRDITNYGKNHDLCDQPDKLLFYIDQDKFNSKKFKAILNRLTDVYEEVADNTNIRIIMQKRVPPPPPPTLPVNHDEVKEIE